MKKFPILEIAIVLATALLLYILIWPNYVKNKEINQEYDLVSNINSFKAVVEMYLALDNNGNIPEKKDAKMIEYLNSFGIINPITEAPYTIDDIQFFYLETPIDMGDNTLSGKHGLLRGAPGTFAVGVYIPNRTTYLELLEKAKTDKEKKALENYDLEATKYTVTAFGKDSIPVNMQDATSEKVEVYFLIGQKTAID